MLKPMDPRTAHNCASTCQGELSTETWYSWFGDYVECGDCHAKHSDGSCAAEPESNPQRRCAGCGKTPRTIEEHQAALMSEPPATAEQIAEARQAAWDAVRERYQAAGATPSKTPVARGR